MIRSMMTGLALASLPVTASAKIEDAPTTTQVRYDDLNLSSPEGMAKLKSRLSRAATRVCPGSDESNLAVRAHANACRKQTLAAIDGQIQLALAKQQTRQARLEKRDAPVS